MKILHPLPHITTLSFTLFATAADLSKDPIRNPTTL